MAGTSGGRRGFRARTASVGALASAAALCALCLAPRADAAWSPPVNIVAQQHGLFDPRVVMDSTGGAVFMWTRTDGGIYTRSRSANGTLSPIRTISPSDLDDYDLAVDSQGNTYFVWRTDDGGGRQIRERVRYSDGTLSPTRTLRAVQGIDNFVGDPRVGVDASGEAVFSWGYTPQSGGFRLETRLRSASGNLSPVQTVAPVWTFLAADMGVDSQGRTTFVWEGRIQGSLAEFSRVMAPNGDLGPVERVSRIGNKASSPLVEVTPSGRAIFSWAEYKSNVTTFTTRARTANGTFQPIQSLGSLVSNQNPALPVAELAVAPTGDAVFCWPADDALHGRTRSVGGDLGATRTIGATTSPSCHLGIDAHGNPTFAWAAQEGSKNRILARSGDTAGNLGPTRALSPAGYSADYLETATSTGGDTAAVWQLGKRGFAIQASFGP